MPAKKFVADEGDILVHSASGEVGFLTGGERVCSMEGCGGRRLATRWPSGKITYPCTKGMLHSKGNWRIL